MLRLNLKTEPYWLNLPAKVKVKVKPISTALMSAAQTMALDKYQELVKNNELDVTNEALRKGTSESVLIKSLAQISIVEWEGVMDAKSDQLAEVNENNINDLMDIWLIAQDFFKKYVSQYEALESEGNESAPAAIGTSAAEAHTAENAD